MLLFHWRSNCALNTIDFCCKTEQIAAPILFFAYLVLNQQFTIITNTYCYFIQRRFVYKKKKFRSSEYKVFCILHTIQLTAFIYIQVLQFWFLFMILLCTKFFLFCFMNTLHTNKNLCVFHLVCWLLLFHLQVIVHRTTKYSAFDCCCKQNNLTAPIWINFILIW